MGKRKRERKKQEKRNDCVIFSFGIFTYFHSLAIEWCFEAYRAGAYKKQFKLCWLHGYWTIHDARFHSLEWNGTTLNIEQFRELILTRFLNPCTAKGRECFSTYSISILCVLSDWKKEKEIEFSEYELWIAMRMRIQFKSVPSRSYEMDALKGTKARNKTNKNRTKDKREENGRPSRARCNKRQLENEIRTKWRLTSFLNAMNYDTMYWVLWLYLHDPFEVFPMLNNLRVMVFHLNFLHPTKPCRSI